MKKNFIINSNTLIAKIPVLIYYSPHNNKQLICRQNCNKSGIYMWTNLITNKSYIGSAKKLNERLSRYFSHNFMLKKLLDGKSIIYSAILKNGYFNFRLDILEYCDLSCLIKKEQYYMDILKPEYNICKTAASWLGNKHTKKTIELMRTTRIGRKHSAETITKLKNTTKISWLSPLRRINQIMVTGYAITLIDQQNNNTIKMYNSIREASRDVNISDTWLSRCMRSNKLCKGRYLIIRKINQRGI